MSTPNRNSAPSSPGLPSVGGKLAAATIALIVVVTIGIYLGLSRYQRESLLSAKEMAALALARLFTDSCVAPVVFEDDSAVNDTLATLGRNQEVEYAGVWTVGPDGALGRRIAELARGPSVVPRSVPSRIALERKPDRLVILSPVRDQSAELVAVAAVSLSLASENRAIAGMQRRTLASSSAVALVLSLLLMGMARVLIVRPLGKLVLAANRLEHGGQVELDVTTNDEVGRLASAFRSMAEAISVREERIRSRNRDMRLVLDNVGQGFVTLDLDGSVSEERSRVVDEWFGTAGAAPKFWDYLQPVDAAIADWFRLGWDTVREDVLPLSLALDQLPSKVRKGEQTFELAYRPILKDERLDKVIVVITDVTARVEREQAERAQREMMSIFRRILADRHAFEEFFAEANALVDAITNWEGSDLRLLARHIHTLKGNCATFELESIVNACDAIESSMKESGHALDVEARRTLRALWASVDEVRSQLSRTAQDDGVELTGDEYAALLSDLRARRQHELLLSNALSFRFEPASKRLALLAEQTRRAASRLGKAPVEVVCRPTRLRLPPERWSVFWSVFTHVIRNTVDHGIETPAQRKLAGKSECATVTLGLTCESEHVVVSVEDDGPGVDWTKIAERARAHGLPHETQRDLEEALFTDGISTRKDVTITSGRGVGLAAVREFMRALDGRIELRSEAGRGAMFRFLLPASMLGDATDRGTAAA